MREVRYGTAIRTGLLSSYAILSSVVALLRVRHYTQYLCTLLNGGGRRPTGRWPPVENSLVDILEARPWSTGLSHRACA